jgi:hypothetical protein
MDINCTLVVQGINFFLVYLLLRHFLFKPVVHSVLQEREEQATLQRDIKECTGAIEHQEQEKRARWLVYQQSFEQEVPSVVREDLFVFRNLVTEQPYRVVPDDRLKQLTSEVVASLVTRVDHVRK